MCVGRWRTKKGAWSLLSSERNVFRGFHLLLPLGFLGAGVEGRFQGRFRGRRLQEGIGSPTIGCPFEVAPIRFFTVLNSDSECSMRKETIGATANGCSNSGTETPFGFVRAEGRCSFVLTLTVGIDRFGQIEGVRSGQIDVGRRHGQNEARLLGDVLQEHVADLGLDVDRLVAHGDLGQARQVDQRDVQHWRRRRRRCGNVNFQETTSSPTTLPPNYPRLNHHHPKSFTDAQNESIYVIERSVGLEKLVNRWFHFTVRRSR